MNEIQAVVALAKEAAAGEPLAMATVVTVHGSAYRRPGARLLLTASGRTAGMISGGCLESDVRERAHQVMASGEPRVVTYDSTAAEEIVFGLGLGCNGIVQVMIEPLTAGEESGLLAFLTACQEGQQAGRLATVFHTEGLSISIAPGTRLLRWPDGRVTTNSANPVLRAALIRTLNDTAERGTTVQPIELADGGRVSALLETVTPPVPLVIFGGGDDALPVTQFAKRLGWHITVVDARPAYAVAERFPMADAVLCLRAESLRDSPQIALSPHALAMIMTHSYMQDRELLRALLPRGLRYIGILGPKARTQRLLDELAAEGTTFPGDWRARLYGPAGLDIGAETPEQVALSLLAEMQAVLANRNGGPLQRRAGGIHDTAGPADAAL